MSRTCKTGLDYFPLEVDFFDDDKILFVNALFKDIGELVAVKLLTRIYRNGYFLEFDNDKGILLSSKFGIDDPDMLNNIVTELLKRGFLDKKKYKDYGILTSKGIQQRYLEATKRRKQVSIMQHYMLLSEKDANIINENVDIIVIDDSISTQRKGKERKGEESKVRHGEIVELKPSVYSKLIDQFGKRELDSKIEDIDNYCLSSGKRYKDYGAAIRAWFKRDGVLPDKNEYKTCPKGHRYTGDFCEQCV